MMLFTSVMLIITIVPSVLIIHIILTSKELHRKKHHYFVANLMVSDIFGAIARFSAKMFLMVLYLLNVINMMTHQFLPWINLFLIWTVILTHLTSSISFIPLAVERFITITFPYRYRNILTEKRAVLMGVAVWIVSAALGAMAVALVDFEIVMAFGEYVPGKNAEMLILIGFIVQTLSLLLITSTNVYLHRQINTSNKKLTENQQMSCEDDSQTKTLKRNLQVFYSQAKLMISLQMLGGIDCLICLIYPTLMALLLLTNLDRETFLLIQLFLLQPLQWSVSLFHSFIFSIYNKIVYKKFIRRFKQCQPSAFSRHSKVIALNQ